MRKTLTAAVAALLVLGGATAAQAADEPAEATVWQAWIMPTDGTDWPQLEANDENLAAIPCGTTVRIQNDEYLPADRDRFVADGILYEGEDYGSAISWEFGEYTADPCITTVTPITPAITAGVGACTDGAWTVTPSVVTFTSVPNGRYSVDGIEYVENPGPIELTTSEVTIGFRTAEGNFRLGGLPADWRLENGTGYYTATPIAVEPDDCAIVTPPITVEPETPAVEQPDTEQPDTEQPSAVQPVTPAETPDATVPASQVGTSPVATTKALAVTGAEDVNPGLIWVAALAMLGGALLFRRHLSTTTK